MEEQEVLNAVPLTPDDVLMWAAEARQQLLDATGVELPQLPVGSVTSKASLAVDWLGVAIPKGVLFYPCCGRDTEDAVRLFGSSVTACHFADPYLTLPGQPRLDGQLQRQIEIRHVGHVVVGPTSQRRVNSVSCPVFTHQKDGLLTLIDDVSSVAVFFCRGDSQGEGGSGQRVLGPVAFHVLLARLLDGGLICTDGSNCGYYDDLADRYAPWNAFAGIRPSAPPELGAAFEYAGRTFTLVGIAPIAKAPPVYVWQVRGLE